MTALGKWGRMPLRMGGGRSRARAIYESMRDAMGTAFSRDDSTRANRELRCQALAIARADAAQQRGGNQALPDLASDRLPDWERTLQAPVDPDEPAHLRAATCMGIMAGNGAAERDSIAAAVSLALGGESVSVIVAKAPRRTFTSDNWYPVLRERAGIGSLRAGLHSVAVAYDDGAEIALYNTPTTITIADGSAILVDAIGDGPTVHYYLSVEPGSSDLAWVGSQYPGTLAPFLIGDYPTNPPRSELHHVGIVVSRATAESALRRAKIHAVLGTMLPSWTAYDIITSSPFVLGTGGSELGLGGL